MLKQQFVVPGVTFMFPHIAAPHSMEGSKPKYSVCVLVPKDNFDAIEKFNEVLESAKKQFAAENFKGNVALVKNFPALRDGDAELKEKDGTPKFPGHLFFNASSVLQPRCVDVLKQPLPDLTQGAEGNVIISFYGYTVTGKKGIACGLSAVQQLKEGTGFNSGLDFDDIPLNSVDSTVDTSSVPF